jgi:hypothetical protein
MYVYTMQYGRPYDIDIRRKEFHKTRLQDCPAGPATPEMVDKVKKMLQYFDVVGHMSQMDAIMDAMDTVIGKPFPNHKLPEVESRHTDVTKHFNVTDSDMAYICEVNKMDVELHRSLFPGVPQKCDDFMKRKR